MNIINPIDVAFGDAIIVNATQVMREVLNDLGLGEYAADCLAAPASEPHWSFPKRTKVERRQ